MTLDPDSPPQHHDEDTVSLFRILKENRFLTQMIVFFFLMLFVPLILAWKLDLFLVAN